MSIENDLDLIMDFDKNYCLQIYNPLPLAFKYGGAAIWSMRKMKNTSI